MPAGDPPLFYGYNFVFGDDYCSCKRCPCCGKLVPVQLAPYIPNPYIPVIPSPIWIQPYQPYFEPYTVTVTLDSTLPNGDPEKK